MSSYARGWIWSLESRCTSGPIRAPNPPRIHLEAHLFPLTQWACGLPRCIPSPADPPMDPLQTPTSPLPHSQPKTPQFPPHNGSRVWLLTDGLSPIAISLSRHLLRHGDYVVSGVLPGEFAGQRGNELRALIDELGEQRDAGLQGGDEDADDMDVDDESNEDGPSVVTSGGGDTGNTEEGSGWKEQKRKRWRPWHERFKVVALDGR
jgi:hypothetical protein